ncbi:MAG: SoxR reducing system RseC family protein [Candidatus Omnitrophica bacterium]|nr:SoxR reducing system RseC family protein [Candidatus Omnitrophota bacterium]
MADVREEGIVLSVQGKIAKVKITPQGTCPDSHSGCPVKALAEGREFITEAENTINAQPGERVIVEIETSHFYKGLILVFILPLALLFIGYLIGIYIARLIGKQEEPFGYIFMSIGFVSSFLLMAIFGKNFNPRYRITEFLNR